MDRPDEDPIRPGPVDGCAERTGGDSGVETRRRGPSISSCCDGTVIPALKEA